jgi:hypothetical protein
MNKNSKIDYNRAELLLEPYPNADKDYRRSQVIFLGPIVNDWKEKLKYIY